MKKAFLSITAAAALTAILVVSSCSKNNSTPANANVLVTHASPDAPGVDLYVNGTKANSSALTYPNSTSYLSVASGATNVKVNVTGTMTTVINANLTLTPGANYSIFAIDSVSNIQPLVIVDTLNTPAAASVRFVHLSPDAPAVDIVDSASGATLISNVSFKGYTSFLPLPVGTYTLLVQPHGSGVTALSVPGVSVSTGHIYTIFAKGFLGGTGAQAIGAQIIVNK